MPISRIDDHLCIRGSALHVTLAPPRHVGRYALVLKMSGVERSPFFAGASAVVMTAGVAVFAYRNAVNDTEQGPFTGLLIAGVVVLVLPISATIYRLSGPSRLRVTSTAVTVVTGSLIATRRPGNLSPLWYPYLAFGAVAVLAVVSGVLRYLTHRHQCASG